MNSADNSGVAHNVGGYTTFAGGECGFSPSTARNEVSTERSVLAAVETVEKAPDSTSDCPAMWKYQLLFTFLYNVVLCALCVRYFHSYFPVSLQFADVMDHAEQQPLDVHLWFGTKGEAIQPLG